MQPLKEVFAVKSESETVLVDFDFAAGLGEGETLLGQDVAATVYSGTDAAPEDLIDGSATASGSVVQQSITGGVAGVQYLLTASVGTSAGQSLIITGYLTVESD